MKNYDFSGWATRNNLKCSDGRTIRQDAFKHHDGTKVPLVWSHQRSAPENVLGHALLENRPEGVYAYCSFNEATQGRNAKELVQHGDICSLSIYANQLIQKGSEVMHGTLREISLVISGANPGALIDTVIQHGDICDDEAVIYTGMPFELQHADADNKSEEPEASDKVKDEDKTLQDVFDTLNEEQKTVVYALIGEAMADTSETQTESDDSKGGTKNMKHNVFDSTDPVQDRVLSHADEQEILSMAKSKNVGSLRMALETYAADNTKLAHDFEDIEDLFPDYKNATAGAPELVTRDRDWVASVMSKTQKSPVSRIRTRQMDVRKETIRGSGLIKGNEKVEAAKGKLLKRTTDPQTIYRKDSLFRDDIVDITDFDVVAYQYEIMRGDLNEELATSFMIGDGREDTDEEKISEDHVRSIWNDDDLYTIHQDVDITAMKNELQGSDTSANFGTSYIYAEAVYGAVLDARKKYKGSGSLDFYCTPELLSEVMKARDRNGRRIYDSVASFASALSVGNIYTAEQFSNKIRTTADDSQKQLLGLLVDLHDYRVGATKGGQVTKFKQFDIDFGLEKYSIETRLSAGLTRPYAAIALEENIIADTNDTDSTDTDNT